jgi:transposase-like protein
MIDSEVIVTSNQTDIRFDVPLYTVAEAARALGVHPSTLSTWAKGYVRHLRADSLFGVRRSSPP